MAFAAFISETIFWLFSWSFQKSGELWSSSISFSRFFF
jgi:hypothetical protein